MNHERIRELVALDLYGELDDDERRELDDALAGSEEARALAHEMRDGLGRLASHAEQRTRGDLPSGWREELRAAIDRERGRRARPWPLVAAGAVGFAAGLLMAAWGTTRDPGSSGSGVDVPVAAFERTTAPPPSTARGPLARLGEYLDR